jgi:hypothetical protein
MRGHHDAVPLVARRIFVRKPSVRVEIWKQLRKYPSYQLNLIIQYVDRVILPICTFGTRALEYRLER